MQLPRLLPSAILLLTMASSTAIASNAHAIGHSFWPLGADIAALSVRSERPMDAIAVTAHAVGHSFWSLGADIAGLRVVPDQDVRISPAWGVGERADDSEAVDRHALSPVQMLTALADRLRDIRYRRGGRDPSSGFDCSGFVRYVFRHGLGVELPHSSAAQSRLGHKLDRNELRSGDLVFFRTSGKGISHVGIYLDEGRFIHAPSSGKTVSVSRLNEPYWAKRYAGARRPDVLVNAPARALAGNS